MKDESVALKDEWCNSNLTAYVKLSCSSLNSMLFIPHPSAFIPAFLAEGAGLELARAGALAGFRDRSLAS